MDVDEAGVGSTSFVKRSKPRASGVRRRDNGLTDSAALSTQDAEASGSNLEEDTHGVVFRPRTGGRKATATSSATVPEGASRRSRVLLSDDEEEPAFEIRRSQLNTAAKQARTQGSAVPTPPLSRKGTSLRLSALKEVEPDKVATPDSTGASTPSYTSTYLAELRASTPTTKARDEAQDITVTASSAASDRLAEQFADLDHGRIDTQTSSKHNLASISIPSDEAIRAAKDKRAKLRADFLRQSTKDDYISLDPSSSRQLHAYGDGPHPDSRLPREEDEIGDGEEEFAEFTGATERLPIGQKAVRQYDEDQRREMQAAVKGHADRLSNGAVVDDDMEVDDDEDEWEKAQMSRTQYGNQATKQSASREATPYRAASIPALTPIPTAGTTSARLKQTLQQLEHSSTAHLAVIESTTKSLAELNETERLNKKDLIDVEGKESWFSELKSFIASLASFMDAKLPEIEKLQAEFDQVLAEKTHILALAREKHLRDRLALFWGTPLVPLLPLLKKEDDDDRLRADTSDSSGPSPPLTDNQLSASDQAAFELAKADLRARLTALFADTNAPEYLDPMARTSDDAGSGLHPRSIVSRFQQWRKMYGMEYTQVWGGLSLAQIWEFYALKDMLQSELHSMDANGSASSFIEPDRLAWYQNICAYMTASASEAEDRVDNGDSDMLASVTANVLVPQVLRLTEKSIFDPWMGEHCTQVITLLRQLESLLVTDSTQDSRAEKYVAVVSAFLNGFATHVKQLQDALDQTPTRQVLVPDHQAKHAFLNGVVDTLICNLVPFYDLCSKPTSAGLSRTHSSNLALVLETFHILIEGVLIKVLAKTGGQGGSCQTVQRCVQDCIPSTLWLASPSLARDKAWLDAFIAAS